MLRGMDRDRSARPNTVPWPPLLYGGGAGLALLLHHAAALRGWWVVPALPPMLWLGAALVVAGLVLDLWTMAPMWRSKPNILPHRAATALVTHGPFAFSRNPIYLGNTIL